LSCYKRRFFWDPLLDEAEWLDQDRPHRII